MQVLLQFMQVIHIHYLPSKFDTEINNKTSNFEESDLFIPRKRCNVIIVIPGNQMGQFSFRFFENGLLIQKLQIKAQFKNTNLENIYHFVTKPHAFPIITQSNICFITFLLSHSQIFIGEKT